MNKDRESHRIFLIRHGETDWNKVFRYQGISDVPLNGEGLEQARKLAVRLSRVLPDRVLASPLSRAARTAEVIMELNASDTVIETRSELKEMSFGIWEGLTVAEIREIDLETYEKWRLAPFSCSPAGGDDYDSIFERSKLFASQLVNEGTPGQNTFVVAHGGVLRAIAAALLELGDMDLLWKARFDNCSITIIDIWGTRPSLLLSNDTWHLRITGDEAIASMLFPY
ncbi:MAG: histidine phosphatase family protein [Synergistaceae bacterium]|jgi:alpha-ribazole phosphatase/probable phosphoglycerate mutase|nr:histidine phosphatase family protein [Synergistaceae bacterium]